MCEKVELSQFRRRREVFYPAVKDNVVTIIMAHNHPLCDPTPSDDDLLPNHILRDAEQLLGIPALEGALDTELARRPIPDAAMYLSEDAGAAFDSVPSADEFPKIVSGVATPTTRSRALSEWIRGRSGNGRRANVVCRCPPGV